MIDLTVAQIADIVGGRLADITPAEAAARRVTGTVEFDSRAVTPGGLFLALPGARSDGHDFAAGAVAAGAAAVLAARPVGVPAIVVPPVAAADDRSGADTEKGDGTMTEDDVESAKEEVQELTKTYEDKVGDLAKTKEAEVMEQ